MDFTDPQARLAGVIAHRGDPEGLSRALASLGPAVDELWVVDSSPPSQRKEVENRCREVGAHLVPLLPLGNSDLYRPYMVARIPVDQLFLLDTDEVCDQPLRNRLRDLHRFDGAVVPRWERALESYSYHLRLFRRSKTAFPGPSFGYPEVRGSVTHLAQAERIVHLESFERYLGDRDRAGVQTLIEITERPLTRQRWADLLSWRHRNGELRLPVERFGRGTLESPLDPDGLPVLTRLERYKEYARTRSASAARVHADRLALIARRWFRLEPERQAWWLGTARAVRTAGGLVAFLHLDDASYLERLTEDFDWKLAPGEALRRMIVHRQRTGRPAESLGVVQPLAPRAPDDGVLEIQEDPSVQ